MSEEEFENIIREAAITYKTENDLSLVERARKGISKKTLLNISETSGLSLKELSTLLPVSLRTIQRYKDDERLEPNISEKALLIAEVLGRGIDVISSVEMLQHWLHTTSIALGNRTPISLLDTSFGARMVTDLLGRIEHGVYS